MTRSDPRLRHGAHRTRRDPTHALVPSLLAVLAVSSLITALYGWRGEEARAPQASAATTGALTRPGSSPDRAARPSATPPSGRTSEATSPTPSGDTSPATESATGAATDTPTEAAVALVVLNQTRRSGLAGVVADRLRGRGWSVAGVGNFRGTVPATTVYYPAGAQEQAQTAARNLPTPARIRPRFGNLSTTRLTIVVTDNYPS